MIVRARRCKTKVETSLPMREYNLVNISLTELYWQRAAEEKFLRRPLDLDQLRFEEQLYNFNALGITFAYR